MMQIAIDAGFRCGARLPNTVYASLYFADQDWRKPNRTAYMRALAQHRPVLATVLDWERSEQLAEVLDWAEEAAQWVTDSILVIPKVVNEIGQLPRVIGGRAVRLGYSVPTKFAGTCVPAWEFTGWPVHLLGGPPHRQMQIARYLDVWSVDGNYAQKMAVRWNQFWEPGTARYAADRYWPRLREADGQLWGDDAPYEAFRRSCTNITRAWRNWAT